MKPTPAWPEDRRKDIETLQRLLNEVVMINNGGCVIERLTKCIELAEKLKAADYSIPREPFVQFLIKQACGEKL